MKREAIACILLVFAMAPVLVQAAAPTEEYNMRPLADVDIWLDQRSWYSFYALPVVHELLSDQS